MGQEPEGTCGEKQGPSQRVQALTVAGVHGLWGPEEDLGLCFGEIILAATWRGDTGGPGQLRDSGPNQPGLSV